MEQPQKSENIINPTAEPENSTITSPHLTLEDSPPQTPIISNHSTSPASSPPVHLLTVGSSPENPLVRTQTTIKDYSISNTQGDVPVVSSSVPQEPMAKTKFDIAGDGKVEEKSGGVGGSGGRFRPGLSILKRTKREKMVKRAALGFRVFGAICCLISFSVMAANKNKGWAIDSFYNYKEFKYSLSVNVIGFMYSAGQAFDSVYRLVTGKYALQHPYRYYFDFAVDQIVTYLLISASSSATTRIDDWQLNWGMDKFPDMATASVAISFLAFVAIAFSSLISGYTLCTSKLLQF